MGLGKFIKGQLIDNIKYDGNDREMLAYRYDRGNKQIMMNANLTVRPGQVAVFINEGKVTDVLPEGRHTLNTQNLPLLTIAKSWKYGFDSPFIADIYFLMVENKISQRWGTTSKVGINHEDLGKIYVGANGEYSYKIADPEKFLRKIVATSDEVTIQDCRSHLNTTINVMFKDTLSESGVDFDSAFGNLMEFGELITELGKPSFEALGLELLTFSVADLVMPDSLYKIMEKRNAIRGYAGLNTANYERITKVDSAGEAMVKMAEREGGGGTSSFGMEMGAGLTMGQMMGSMMGNNLQGGQQHAPAQQQPPVQQSAPQAASAMKECSKCHQGVRADMKFCPHCGNSMVEKPKTTSCTECHGTIPLGSKFCPICGNSQEGPQCVKCGAELTEGARFCMQCGTKQETESGKVFCPGCGEELEGDARFCAKCGERI